MKKVACLAVLSWAVVGAAAWGGEIINPHRGQHCNSCHVREPEVGADKSAKYWFLAEDIDPTCLICHTKECCNIGSKHQTHPSNIKSWDKSKHSVPKKIPLQDGRITCVTCHFWRREINEKPQDYKLVRLVDIRPTGVDWTALCSDCHVAY